MEEHCPRYRCPRTGRPYGAAPAYVYTCARRHAERRLREHPTQTKTAATRTALPDPTTPTTHTTRRRTVLQTHAHQLGHTRPLPQSRHQPLPRRHPRRPMQPTRNPHHHLARLGTTMNRHDTTRRCPRDITTPQLGGEGRVKSLDRTHRRNPPGGAEFLSATVKRPEYDTPAYRAARVALRGLPCRVCGVPSDTVDHVPPLVDARRRGVPWSGTLEPACRSCNSALGAAEGRAKPKGSRRW